MSMSTKAAELVERIRLGCFECGDCWVWRGASSRGRQPQIKIDGRCVSVRRALYEAQHGPVPAGKEVAATCETRNCVIHAEPQTHSKIGKRTAATGVYANPARCAKIAASKRALSPLTPEQVQDIRYGPGTLEQIGARHGITKEGAGHIRRGVRWKDYTSPFAGLGARA